MFFPWGGGGRGASLGQPKISGCGSRCCCVGYFVVAHGHLYPFYSWQKILLTFAEMELGNTTMFPHGPNVLFISSTRGAVCAHVVGHSKHGDAYRCIIYEHDGKPVLHDRLCVRRLSLPHAAYFQPHEDEQLSSSSLDSDSDSKSDSGLGDIISSPHDDSSGGDSHALESARDVDVGAKSDVSSLTSAEELP